MIFPLASAASFSQSASSATTKSESVMETIVSSGPLWIGALLVFVASFFIASVVKKVVSFRVSNSSRNNYSKEVIILIEKAVYWLTVLFGTIIAFAILGINIATLLGFLGVGLGFGLKSFMSNFVAGIVILTQKKFMIGDTIEVNGMWGKITEIETRSTQIEDFDGTVHVIPNEIMLTSAVRNCTKNSFRRIDFQVGVHYTTPLEDAIKLILWSVKKHQDVVEKPETKVLVQEFGDSAIILEVRFWIESTKPWPPIRSEIMRQLKKDFDNAGITIPYPIRTLAVDEYDKNLFSALKLGEAKKPEVKLPSETPL